MSEFKGGDENINRRGRPKGSGKKISALKSVFNKLKRVSEKAIENVEKSVNGQEVDKEILLSSKWVVNTLQSYNKAILQEEGFKESADADEKPVDPEVDEKPAAFSLKMVK